MTVHLPRRLHAVRVCAHGMPMDVICEGCDWDRRRKDAEKRGLLDDVCPCGLTPVIFGPCDCEGRDNEKRAAMRAAVEGW